MRPIRCAALALILMFPGDTRAQQPSPAASNLFGIEPGAYPVGFQLLEEQDHSRARRQRRRLSGPPATCANVSLVSSERNRAADALSSIRDARRPRHLAG